MAISVNRHSPGFLILMFSTVVIVILGAAFSYSNFQAVRAQQEWVNHTHEVLMELEAYMSSLKDAETGVRGYVLTGRENFLDPYHLGRTGVETHYDNLVRLVSDNPVQNSSLVSLHKMGTERLSILARALEEYKTVGRAALTAPERATESKSVMDSVRLQIDTMKSREVSLLQARGEETERSVFYFQWALIVSTALTVTVMAFAFYNIYRTQQKTISEARRREIETWRQSRVAEAAQLLVEEQSFERAGRGVLGYLAQVTPLLAASFYWQRGRNLNLVSSYAASVGQGVSAPSAIALPDGGLTAEAFSRKDVFVVENVPGDYFQVSSSLGQARPGHLVFLPIRFQGRNLGIIEMASFETFGEDILQVLQDLSETLGVGLNAAQTREELQAFLERTQQQAEELQTQQEELRTTNEELEQQARALETQQNALSERNLELESTRREVESKARDLERESQYKSDFLAKMSHELRTPLNSLLILATLLIENKEQNLNTQQKDFAKSIRDAGNDLLNLINDILDLSKIEARKLVVRPETFGIAGLFKNLESAFKPQAELKGVKFEVAIDETLEDAEMYTDRQRLEQVLRNFLSNAMKFTEQGSITLAVAPLDRPGWVSISVADTGIGIPESKRDLIFEAFEQADSTVSRKFGGTGLGLTISRELSSLLGGRIVLQTLEDEGSTFSIQIPSRLEDSSAGGKEDFPATPSSLPLPSAQAKAVPTASVIHEAREAVKHLAQNAKSLLIVEDDNAFRKVVAEQSRAFGFEPIEAASGDVALEILNRHTPSSILLDVKLPVISGMGLLEMIKRRPQLRHIPIHMISSLDYQQNALRLGAVGYLGKPVSLEKVREALGKIDKMISKKTKRLLVVEDDKRQREAIVALVTGKDIEIQALETGESALKAMTEIAFDCIILDLSLPDLSGFDILGRLSELKVNLPPIVIYTAQELSPEREEYLRKYSESIIIKGARSPERLLDEVNLFLHRVDSALPDDKRAMLEAMRSQTQAFQGKRVLLVDDDLRNVFALTSALETRGFIVSIARNGVEAVEAVEKSKDFDVILMDLMMPKMDGLEATKRIRALDGAENIPIIALTAKAMKEDHERCIAAGATDYLPKPIDLTNLLSTLNVWVARKDLFS